MKYQPAIGLEIHSELKTQSKMFCDCQNDPDETRANVNICPVCTAQPGSLPVANQAAIEKVIKTGLAVKGSISDTSIFDRKNYFYPDLPKGYQISQLYYPLVKKGHLEINGDKIKIREIHLEEDTGRLIHPSKAKHSLVDYNRAGVPLMELVTEPDIEDGRTAKQFCEQLQMILRYLNVSEANMEKGQMRCEVNISIRSASGKLGTKVEIKNLNSFRSVERSIDYEINRQTKALESGEKIIQETRGWDDNKQKTISQRTKEGSADYRYFPEPDLPPLTGLKQLSADLAVGLPELPQAKAKRFSDEYKLPDDDIQTLIANKALAGYFESVVSELKTWLKIKGISDKDALIKLTANYFLTELQKLLVDSKQGVDECKISAENFAEFVAMIAAKEISSSAAQTVLREMFVSGADPSHVVEEKDLRQVSDEGALGDIVEAVIKNNPKPAGDLKAGNDNALKFLIGQVMKQSKGQANPEVASKMLRDKILN